METQIVELIDEIVTPFLALGYVEISVGFAAFFWAMKKAIGKPLNVDWYALVHALLTGPPALLCIYLDTKAALIVPGSDPEPLRSIKCAEALTTLHSIIPMISLGYGGVDILEGVLLGRKDFVLHGLSMVISLGSCCYLGKSHLVAATLIMELSSVPLNFLHCTIQNHLFIMAVQLTFMLTFFFARLVVVPWLWYGWVKTYYETVIVGGSESCFPWWFIYVVVISGMTFHCLNVYWMVYILKKAKAAVSGEKKDKTKKKKKKA